MKIDNILEIGNLVIGGNFDNPQRGRVYSPKGIAPAIYTYGGGQPGTKDNGSV
jgi:hypothetical protein